MYRNPVMIIIVDIIGSWETPIYDKQEFLVVVQSRIS